MLVGRRKETIVFLAWLALMFCGRGKISVYLYDFMTASIIVVFVVISVLW